MAGRPTTWGVPALAQAVVPADAPVVERMRAAGDTDRPDQSARHGATHTYREFAARSHAQSLAPRSHRRRLQRRRGGGTCQRHEPDWAGQRHRRLAAQSGQRLRHRVDPPVCRPCAGSGLCAGRRPIARGRAHERAGTDGPPRRRCAPRPADIDRRAPTRPLVDRRPLRWPGDGPADPRGGAGRAARGQHRSKSGGDRATCSACAGRRRLCRGRNLPAPLRAVAARVVFGASSFNFSKASGIMRPNIELSMAVGMRPPEFSAPCAPDIRNCGTSG